MKKFLFYILSSLFCILSSKKLAEGEGFEPPVPCGTAIFKTAALNHSATLPYCEWWLL